MASAARDGRGAGVALAAAAYLIWGTFPLYFRALRALPAPQMLAQRIAWSAIFLAGVVSLRRGWPALAQQLRAPRAFAWLVLSATLIAGNWLVYIWAVNANHVLEASLGYFVNPLVSVLLGVLFLREPLTRRQVVAVLLAAAGVLVLVVRAGRVPWIALFLAGTFGIYGLIRKRVAVDATAGLAGEVAALLPLAAGFLLVEAARGRLAFPATAAGALLVAASGPLTAVPLIWFAVGVRRLRLATIGLLQYLNPSLQFAIAVFLFDEPWTPAHRAAFGFIWAALALYTTEALAQVRRGA